MTYPAIIVDENGDQTAGNTIEFTDPDNQPSTGPPFQATAGEDLSLLQDSDGDKIIEYDDDGGILELNSPDRNQQLYISNAGVQLPLNALSLLGFYGATPVAQPAAPVTLGDVIAALKALGLVAT